MMLFIWGFLAGAVSLAAVIGFFVSWACAEAEKSICEDIQQPENDNL